MSTLQAVRINHLLPIGRQLVLDPFRPPQNLRFIRKQLVYSREAIRVKIINNLTSGDITSIGPLDLFLLTLAWQYSIASSCPAYRTCTEKPVPRIIFGSDLGSPND
ncbi:hypothetical protein QTP88_005171 [Uroleucon formosanum]